MENTMYGKRREGRWTPIRAKAQDTRANSNSWETHLVRKRWDIGLLRALSLWIMMVYDDINGTHVLIYIQTYVLTCISPVYLHKLCCPLLCAMSSGSLCSSQHGLLLVPFAHTSTKQSCPFSMVGPLT